MSIRDNIGTIRERFLTAVPPRSPALSVDDLYMVLSNRRRRYTLHYLLHEGSTCDIGTIADTIAAWENRIPVDDVTSTMRKRVYTALQQNHLPKMEDVGIIVFNRHRGVVEPTEEIHQIDIYLDVVSGRQVPWSKYYVGLAVAGYLLLASVWLVGYPFTLVPNLVWGFVVCSSFALSAVAHLFESRRRKLGTSDLPPELK